MSTRQIRGETGATLDRQAGRIPRKDVWAVFVLLALATFGASPAEAGVTVFTDQAAFESAAGPLRSIDFSHPDSTVPSADPYWYLYDTSHEGVCFQRVFNYYGHFVYTYPRVNMRANLPPETYAVGWRLGRFYPITGGTFTITLSSGDVFQRPSEEVFFGVVSDVPIAWVTENLDLTYPIWAGYGPSFFLTESAGSVASCPPPDDTQGPEITDLTASPNPVAVNMPVDLTAIADDLNTGGSLISSAHYSIDGGPQAPMTGTFNSSSTTSISAGIGSFEEAGMYDVCVSATDSVGNNGDAACLALPVYDPAGGFVTGGGWFSSPAGAYRPDPEAEGKATFGFVSKYQVGTTVPTGSTKFVFHGAKMLFRSSSYDWMVIAGARVKYRGEGTINGEPGYRFMLTAIDGEMPGGGGEDKLRVQIWNDDGVVYDNQYGDDDDVDPTTTLGGGSIEIHP